MEIKRYGWSFLVTLDDGRGIVLRMRRLLLILLIVAAAGAVVAL